MRASRGEFDAVIAGYHDQGLIPVKLLAFGHAVNVTIGLPFVRTSVDHGTGFDIVEKGMADGRSLVEAMKLAVQLAGHRYGRRERASGRADRLALLGSLGGSPPQVFLFREAVDLDGVERAAAASRTSRLRAHR